MGFNLTSIEKVPDEYLSEIPLVETWSYLFPTWISVLPKLGVEELFAEVVKERKEMAQALKEQLESKGSIILVEL